MLENTTATATLARPTYRVETLLIAGDALWRNAPETKTPHVLVDGLGFEAAFDYAAEVADDHGDPDEYATRWTRVSMVNDGTGDEIASWTVA